MNNSLDSSVPIRVDEPGVYRIVVQGRLDDSWSDWFGGMELSTLQNEDGQTVTSLSGPIVDQSQLHSVLRRVRDLGLTLLLVELVTR